MTTDKTQTPHDPQAAAKLDSPEPAKGEQAPKAAKGASPDSQTPRDPEAHAKLDSSAGAKGVQDVPFLVTPDQRKAEAKRRAARDDSNEPTAKEERVQEEKKDDAGKQSPMVQALLIEREGLAAQGKDERVALVDEQLVYHGYDPKRKAAEKRAAAAAEQGEDEKTEQPKARQTPQSRNRTA